MASQSEQGEKIDLNAAEPEELERIEGIDSQRARLILDAREKLGAFRSWEEVEEIPGIGETLVHRLQEGATLKEGGTRKAAGRGEGGRSSGRQRQQRREQQSSEEGGQEQQEEQGPAGMALMALAQLDLEAAEAYRIGAESMVDEEINQQLMSFRDDHLRHVDEIEKLASRMGEEPLDREDVAGSVLVSLAEAAGELGPFAAILAMISNERLTNSTYEAVLALAWEEDVQQLLERNRDDERRHLGWLEDNRDRVAAAEAEQEQAADRPAT